MVEQKEREREKIAAQEKKEGSFILPASSYLTSWHCSVPSGNSQTRKSYAHEENTSGVSDQLLHPFRAPQKGPASVSPTQTGKAEMYTDGEEHKENQGLPTAAMQQEQLWFTVLLCR